MSIDDMTTATSPEPRFADATTITARAARSFWSRLSGTVMTSSTGARGTVLRRDLSDGAIAGTVIGVVVAVAVLAFCLYPVVIYQLKRRKRSPRYLDAEAGGQVQASNGAADLNSHRRLSSTDSFKQNEELSRGEIGGGQSKELGWIPGDANVAQTEANLERIRQFSTRTEHGAWQQDGVAVHGDTLDDDYRNESTPFPYYMPASMPDDNPGVLKGTSHDYYSPSIPSSAFGMVTTPDLVEPARTLSRGRSVKYNIKHILRRTSGRGSSLASVLSTEDKSASPRAYQGTELGRILTIGDSAGSPTKLSPTTSPAQPPPAASAVQNSLPPSQPVLTTPPQSPLPDKAAFKASPSPPSHPAPGTVNPMDIMPATTQSEMRHRTEHQLLATSYGSSPAQTSSSEQGDQGDKDDFLTFTPPPVSAPSPSEVVQLAPISTPTNQEVLWGSLKREDHDVPMAGLRSHDHLSPSMIPERSRHPSYPSDHSTSFQGTHSTGQSTENTPSTQLDSPSPGSMNSSDFRHSASPRPGLASPRIGVFQCDEPGCGQAFDQPHKLKHHRRYHSKDHKCPYVDCGKGFGTKTHLQRHINDRHEKTKKFHCAIPGCDYSKIGSKAFQRKDNWKRHMTKIHNMDQQHLPEPIEVDSGMGGT